MAQHKKEASKLDMYLIFVLTMDTLILTATFGLAFLLSEFPPAGAWAFFTAVFGGEAALAAWIKRSEIKYGQE